MKRTKDKGIKNMFVALKAAQGKEIQVGIFDDAIAKRSYIPKSEANKLGYRYRIHDQGLGNNPKRETLNPAVDDAISKDPVVNRFLSLNLDKSLSIQRRHYNRASLRVVAAIKKEITDLKQPKKLETTIRSAQRKYGGSRRTNALIQSGEMRNAVTFRYI